MNIKSILKVCLGALSGLVIIFYRGSKKYIYIFAGIVSLPVFNFVLYTLFDIYNYRFNNARRALIKGDTESAIKILTREINQGELYSYESRGNIYYLLLL
jgi:hypothetical protein